MNASSISPVKLGLGVGIAAFLVTLVSMAGGNSNVRYINVEGTTLRMTKLDGGRFEVAAWGKGILLLDANVGDPMATYLFGQDGPLDAKGNPDLIDLIKVLMNKVPANLFDPAMSKCSRPGCFVKEADAVSGITPKDVLAAVRRRPSMKGVKQVLPYSRANLKLLQSAGVEYEFDTKSNTLRILK